MVRYVCVCALHWCVVSTGCVHACVYLLCLLLLVVFVTLSQSASALVGVALSPCVPVRSSAQLPSAHFSLASSYATLVAQ